MLWHTFQPHLEFVATYVPVTMTSVATEVATNSLAPSLNYKFSIGLGIKNHMVVDVALRVLLFVTAFVALVVIVTSKQTKLIPVSPGVAVPVAAKFTHSPSYTYFVAAITVACTHSIVTGIISVLALMKPGGSPTRLQFHFVILDTLLLGIVAAATGAAGGVAYMGLKGNSHTRWMKICHIYDSFCDHLGVAISLSLVSAIALLLLVWLSIYVLSKRVASQ